MDDRRIDLTATCQNLSANTLLWSQRIVRDPLQPRIYTVLRELYRCGLQEFGKQAWNLAAGPRITLEDVDAATILAVDDLDQGFFRARIDKTADAERDYLRAMASLGGPDPIDPEMSQLIWGRKRRKQDRPETASSSEAFATLRATATSHSRYPCLTSSSDAL